MEANRNKDMKMKELDTKEIEMVSGGFDGWEQLGVGIATVTRGSRELKAGKFKV